MKYTLSFLLSILLLSSCINSAPRTRDGKTGKVGNTEEEGLELLNSVPLQGATGVSKGVIEVKLQFNKALATSGPYKVRLQSDCGESSWHISFWKGTQECIPLKEFGEGSSLSDDGTELTIKVSQELLENSNYVVHLRSDFPASDGKELGLATAVSFSTEISPLRYLGYEMSTNPDTKIEIHFNKAVDQSTVFTNSDTTCNGPEGKWGIHVKCGDHCVPSLALVPNVDKTVYTLEPQQDLPFNSTCELLIYKENLRSHDGQSLENDVTATLKGIDGFTISGSLTYESIPLEDNKLNFSESETRPVPPLKVSLYKNGKYFMQQACSYTAIGCLYEFDDLPKGAYELRLTFQVDPSGGVGTVAVRNNLTVHGDTYFYTHDISGDEEIEENHSLAIHLNEAQGIYSRICAILDTLWRLNSTVDPSASFTTHGYWNQSNIAVSTEQVDIREGYLPTTFSAWNEVYSTVGEIYILGDRRIDSDDLDRQVLAREWTRLYLDKIMEVYQPSRSASYGKVKLDSRVAFYEGLLNSWGAMSFGDSRYSDSIGTQVSVGGSGWGTNFDPEVIDHQYSLWASSEELASFFIKLSTLFPANGSESEWSKLIYDSLRSNRYHSDIFSFLRDLRPLLSSEEISTIKTLDAEFGFNFDQVLLGLATSGCLDGDCFSYQVEVGDTLELDMQSYSTPAKLGYLGNSRRVLFRLSESKKLQFKIEGQNDVIVDLYALEESGLSLKYTTLGASSSSFIHEDLDPSKGYLVEIRSIEVETAGDNKVTFSITEVVEDQENTASEGKSGGRSEIDFAVGKTTLVGDISFERRVGSKKVKVLFDPIFKELKNPKIKFVGLDGVSIVKVDGEDPALEYDGFESGVAEIKIQGAHGKLVIYIEGSFNERFRNKVITYIL